MILVWRGAVAYGDDEQVADLCNVSVRTVQRHCIPAVTAPPAGPGTVQALYHLEACRRILSTIKPRRRTRAAP